MRTKGKQILLLHLIVLIYSFSAVFMKLAASYEAFSLYFLLYYILSLILLLVYAVFWQQILKHLKLSVAYINRTASMLYTVLFGVLFFNEVLTLKHILGIMLIFIGLIIVVTADE